MENNSEWQRGTFGELRRGDVFRYPDDPEWLASVASMDAAPYEAGEVWLSSRNAQTGTPEGKSIMRPSVGVLIKRASA